MLNDTSVFPVALLENAVTRPIVRLHIKAKKYAVHLSDEPMRCPFPMNCLFSTCRLTLTPGGWSATQKLLFAFPDYPTLVTERRISGFVGGVFQYENIALAVSIHTQSQAPSRQDLRHVTEMHVGFARVDVSMPIAPTEAALFGARSPQNPPQ
jgi:hypothetical protein